MAPAPRTTNTTTTGTQSPHRKRCKTKIVIPLRSKPRDYVPCSGPPLQPLRLLPPQDSTGYILERILLPSPGLARDGHELPKRMTYIVGFHDLAAARLLVPAMRILDYVSPRALEEWEWQMELEVDEERAKLAAEKSKKPEQLEKNKHRGRPPAHSKIETAAVAVEAEPSQSSQHSRGGAAMSLTTPTKLRLEDFEGLSDDDEEASPSRQLEQETLVRDNGDLNGIDTLGDEGVIATQQDQPVIGTLPTKEFGAGPKRLFGVAAALTTGSKASSIQQSAARLIAEEKTKAQKKTCASEPSTLTQGPVTSVPHLNGAALPLQYSSSFTPAGRSASFSKSEQPSALGTPQEDSEQDTSSKITEIKKGKSRASNKRSRNEKSKALPEQDDDGEPQWEVKRLEDTDIYEDAAGNRVRYFLVRWEGDWPEDQNPSWEPEDNLPPELVRKYLKKQPKKMVAAPSRAKAKNKKKTKNGSALLLGGGPQYNSVSEAFAGGHEDVGMMGYFLGDENGAAPLFQNEDDDDDDNQDEFLVVEEQSRKKDAQARSSWTATNSKSRSELNMYR